MTGISPNPSSSMLPAGAHPLVIVTFTGYTDAVACIESSTFSQNSIDATTINPPCTQQAVPVNDVEDAVLSVKVVEDDATLSIVLINTESVYGFQIKLVDQGGLGNPVSPLAIIGGRAAQAGMELFLNQVQCGLVEIQLTSITRLLYTREGGWGLKAFFPCFPRPEMQSSFQRPSYIRLLFPWLEIKRPLADDDDDDDDDALLELSYSSSPPPSPAS